MQKVFLILLLIFLIIMLFYVFGKILFIIAYNKIVKYYNEVLIVKAEKLKNDPDSFTEKEKEDLFECLKAVSEFIDYYENK